MSYNTNIQKLSKKFRRSVSWSKSREEGVTEKFCHVLSEKWEHTVYSKTSNVLMKIIFVLLHLNAPQRDLTAKKQFRFEY